MDDSISRQAAVDAAREELDSGTFYDIPSKIEQLPSAQPEIIRCRDCKWWDSEYRECYSPNWDNGHFITPSGFFCGWAIRSEE